MAPLRRLPEGLTAAQVEEMARLAASIRQHNRAADQAQARLDRLVAAASAAGASHGALAEVIGSSRSGLRGMVRRGLREETR